MRNRENVSPKTISIFVSESINILNAKGISEILVVSPGKIHF